MRSLSRGPQPVPGPLHKLNRIPAAQVDRMACPPAALPWLQRPDDARFAAADVPRVQAGIDEDYGVRCDLRGSRRTVRLLVAGLAIETAAALAAFTWVFVQGRY